MEISVKVINCIVAQVVMQNEAYTSSVSSLELEPVNSNHSDKSRRIKRGLFQTGFCVMNSEINGRLNILRKYLKDKKIPRLISVVSIRVSEKTLLDDQSSKLPLYFSRMEASKTHFL